MSASDLLHPDFRPDFPYWWEFFEPRKDLDDAPPKKTSVAIIGGGYTGLTAARALAACGIDATVLEAHEFGFGASTRNGGGVGGAVNVGKSLAGRRITYPAGQREAIMGEAARAYRSLESLVADDGIECDWIQNGRFIGAWTPQHYRDQEKSLDVLNGPAELDASLLPRERQREVLATDIYHGGLLVNRSATLNPALLYKGLLDRAITANSIRLCGGTMVRGVERCAGGWRVETSRGVVEAENVIVGANGYIDPAVQGLRRKIIPVYSNIIVTEELPDGLAAKVFPTNRYVNDTLRIRSYYRLTPDGKRLLFGGRGRFGTATAQQNASALSALMVERLPDFKGIKVEYAWSGLIAFTFDSIPHVGQQDGMYFALGCNGSGVAMMTYLGDYLGRRIAGDVEEKSAFERPLPGAPLYTGNPWFLPAIGRYFQFLDRRDSNRT